MIFSLAEDFAAALETLPQDHPKRRMLRLLDEAIRRDIHFIDRHPTTLFQCLWNTCWWYDCPEAARHFGPQEGRSPGGAPLPWELPGARLCDWVERWRTSKETATAGFPWLRSVRPTASHLASPQKAVFRGHEEQVNAIAYSPDGRQLASAAGRHDGSHFVILIWDAETGAQRCALRGHANVVSAVAFSPDGQRIVSGSHDRTVRLWDNCTGAELNCLRGHSSLVLGVAFSPDGRHIVSGSCDKTVRLWDACSGVELRRLVGHEDQVNAVAWSPDGALVASAAGCRAYLKHADDTVRLWDASTGRQVRLFRGHGSEVTPVAFSPDGHRMATGSCDKTIRVWDTGNGAELRCLRGHQDAVTGVAFLPDAWRVVSSSEDKTVRLWDVDAGSELACLKGHESRVSSVACSPDRQHLASGSWDRTVRCCDGEMAGLLDLYEDPTLVCWVRLSPDGERLVSVCEDDTVRVTHVRTGVELHVLSGHRKSVRSAEISCDNERLVSADDDTVRVWDLEAGTELWSFRAPPPYSFVSLHYPASGPLVVWHPQEDYALRLVDGTTGQETLRLHGHTDKVGDVVFSPDGRQVLTGSYDGTARLWCQGALKTGQWGALQNRPL